MWLPHLKGMHKIKIIYIVIAISLLLFIYTSKFNGETNPSLIEFERLVINEVDGNCTRSNQKYREGLCKL